MRISVSILLALALAACSRPAATDCPPPSAADPIAADSAQTTDPADAQPTPTLPETPEAIEVRADDGHVLHMWLLASPAPSPRPAILLLHGRTWSSAPDFDLRVDGEPALSLARTLAAAGYAVYGLDLRGYGKTPRDADGWLEPDRAAEDLAAALAQIREREGQAPDLLGWSYGALISQLAVQRHPEAVRKLVLYGYPRDPDARLPEQASTGEPPKQANTEEAARSDFITAGTISEAAIAAYVAQSLAADAVKVDWRDIHQFNQLDPAKISVPTLVLHGVGDPIARQLWQAKLFTRMTVEDRQWVILPRADHAAHLEQPADFVRALRGFLED